MKALIKILAAVIVVLTMFVIAGGVMFLLLKHIVMFHNMLR